MRARKERWGDLEMHRRSSRQEHVLSFTFEQGSNEVQPLPTHPSEVSSPAYASTYNIKRSPPAEEGHLDQFEHFRALKPTFGIN
jgi:hypothetical protein